MSKAQEMLAVAAAKVRLINEAMETICGEVAGLRNMDPNELRSALMQAGMEQPGRAVLRFIRFRNDLTSKFGQMNAEAEVLAALIKDIRDDLEQIERERSRARI
jgi:hypothetical protein